MKLVLNEPVQRFIFLPDILFTKYSEHFMLFTWGVGVGVGVGVYEIKITVALLLKDLSVWC